MKKLFRKFAFICVCVLIGCNSEDTWNCFQQSGAISTIEIDVPIFDKITVLQRTQLIIKEGENQKVVLETGKNLVNDIDISVKNGVLTIDNSNACNLTRDYGITKVFVTTNQLREIRNASNLSVISDGIITFPDLILRSDDLIEEDFYRKVGDFRLAIASENIRIETNGKSNFYLTGSVSNISINFLEGDNRCECSELKLKNATIFHRGTNDIFINPDSSATGELRSVGNLVLSKRPPVLDVKALYKGKVIIKE